ncbi:MAG: hypothetical protein AAF587_34205 [Bacteroidota bacterium]
MKFPHLQIPNPCHENWDTMSPTEQGRFCRACSKEIFDFSDGNTEQFEQIWKEQKGQLCARFRSQDISPGWNVWSLGRTSAFSRFRRGLATIIAVLGLGLADTYAQDPPSNQGGQIIHQVVKEKEGDLVHFSGMVLNENGKQGLARAVVVLLDGEELLMGTFADEEGAFAMDIPPARIHSDSLTLKVRYLNHIFVKEGLEARSADLTIELKADLWILEVALPAKRLPPRIVKSPILIGSVVINKHGRSNQQPKRHARPPYDNLQEWIWISNSEVFSDDF